MMISDSDCVTLSDDDKPVEVSMSSQSKIKKKVNIGHVHSDPIETIVIDEDIIKSQRSNHNENNNIIELSDSQEFVKQKPVSIDKICKEHPLFTDFIEKCLETESSNEMITILTKTVYKLYKSCDEEYRKSSKFDKVLFKALQRLETDPDHKFSHIKDVVETLKFHKRKKRVQLTTLTTNLKENCTKSKNSAFQEMRNCTIKESKSRINSIVLDSDDEVPTINLDDYIPNNDVNNLNEEKENHVNEHGNIHSDDYEPINNVNNSIKEKENYVNDNGSIQTSQENFLEPQVEVSWSAVSVVPVEFESVTSNNETEKSKKIKAIEEQIGKLKKWIDHYEEAEVNANNNFSQYILCDKYKAQVVQLYKELCQLTGDQPVKHRTVRLQVLEGHPPGPVKRLENFINENIGEDGLPLFPDFHDVVKCVMVADIEDKLMWNRQQVMREAHSLFNQCGRALQKQRQRREYRDLLYIVKTEKPDYDPADADLELRRKLEENKRIAEKNELELLERYVKLQNLPKPGPSLTKEPKEQTTNDQPITNDAQNRIETSSPTFTSDESERKSTTSSLEIVSDEDSNFEPPEVKLSQEITEDKTESTSEETTIKIKQEPIDIVQMLEDLGDNYQTTILDIEDPFLVIEISSDDESSDEEMQVDGESDC